MNLSNAPEKGILYALYVDRMDFFKYKNLEEVTASITENNLLELHLFDEKKEFRVVKTYTGKFFNVFYPFFAIFFAFCVRNIPAGQKTPFWGYFWGKNGAINRWLG